MLEILLVAALAAADPAPARAPTADVPNFLNLGETVIEGWALKAETYVEKSVATPRIGSIYCDLKRNGLVLRAFREAGFRMDVTGRHPDHDEGEDFGFTNIHALVLDGTLYEARWAGREGPIHFDDVDYPPPPVLPDLHRPGDLISPIPVLSAIWGALSVRRPGETEWHTLDALVDDVLRARRLRVGFRRSTDEHGVEGPPLWAEVPLHGLAPALAWCRKTMMSPKALRLHPERSEGRGKP